MTDPKWSEARQAAMVRDWYECQECLANIPLTVHHIWPRGLGGGNQPFNLVTLCDRCHRDLCKRCTRALWARDPEWSRYQGTRGRTTATATGPARKFIEEWS